MLGIGLGGLSRGFERGWGIGEKIEKSRKERQEQEEWGNAVAAGKADFDAAVASGAERPNDVPASLRYAMPRIITPLLKSGDVKGAAAAAEWLQSDETKQGARLFESGLVRLQTGDVKGALTDLQRLSKLRGYGLDFELTGSEEMPNGKWRLRARSGDGKEADRELSVGEIGDLFATHLNEESAWKNFRERQENDAWRRDIFGQGAGYNGRLKQSESGGRADATNELGYAGLYQFGAPRLAELGVYQPGSNESLANWSRTKATAPGKWGGAFNIPGHPEVKTLDDFLASPEAQETVNQLHAEQNDADIASRGLKRYIGTTVGGVPITKEGIHGMMHLGGARGAERFLKSGGKYNPADANGTRLSDYARMGASSGGVKVAQADTGTTGGFAERFGLTPEEADMLAALGPTEGKKRLTKRVFEERPTLRREFEHAKRNGFDGDQFDFITAKQQAGAPTVERIRGKIARGEKLTPGEQRVYDDATKLSLFDKILLGQGQPASTMQPALAESDRPVEEGAGAVPPAHIEILRSDPSPEARREFDEVYGQGAAERVLGG